METLQVISFKEATSSPLQRMESIVSLFRVWVCMVGVFSRASGLRVKLVRKEL